jgi:predicted nucleotidyltransferase
MTYKISSDKFRHPLLKPILEKLTEYFDKEGIHFYVIGATARDILMEISGERAGRKTLDLDIAMAISD